MRLAGIDDRDDRDDRDDQDQGEDDDPLAPIVIYGLTGILCSLVIFARMPDSAAAFLLVVVNGLLVVRNLSLLRQLQRVRERR